MPYCKVCGYELTNPESDLHDPEGLSDVAKEYIGGPNEAEDAHLIVRDGEKGWRYYCSESGKVTTIVDSLPDENQAGEGETPPSQDTPKPSPNESSRSEIYDTPDEKTPVQVLAEVVTRPFIGLNQDQIEEVRDWAQDYDGQLPPDMLEDILGNMSGVNKQTAALARQKYEVKLNAWVQQQTRGKDGPPIGITARPPDRRSPQGGSQSSSVSPSSDSEGGSSGTSSGQPSSGNGSIPTGDLREYRRSRRTKRRNDALDTAAETAAREMADEMAREFAQNFGFAFKLVRTVLMKKAEKDPDWFLEKADEWDVDILNEFLTPSEARREEMARPGTEVDREIDDALQQTMEQEEIEEQDIFDDEEDDLEQEYIEEEGDMEGLFDDELVTQGGEPQ